MGKEKLSYQKIIDGKSVQASNILALLEEFQDKEYQGKKGLRQIHFRYALIENPDIDKTYSERRLKEFFEPKLTTLIESNKIRKGCINTRQNLNYYLKEMKEIGVIYTKGKGKNTRYFKNDNLMKYDQKEDIHTFIDRWPMDQLLFFVDDKKESDTCCLFGMDKKFLLDHKKEIEDNIQRILDILNDIESQVKNELLVRRKELIEDIEETDILKNYANRETFLKQEVKNFQNIFDPEAFDKISTATWEKIIPKVKTAFMAYEIWKRQWSSPGLYYKDDKQKAIARGFYRNLKNIFRNITGGDPIYMVLEYHKMLIRLFEGGNFSDDEKAYFTSVWSKSIFKKDYGFSLEEVKEIIDFVTLNFGLFGPLSGSVGFIKT